MADLNVLNYNTREGQALFRTATASLYADRGDPYDCDPEGLSDFLQLVEDRCTMMGYHEIYQIPDTTNPLIPVTRHFLHSYGVLSTAMVRTHVATYINTPTRTAQDSFQVYHCLMNSLSLNGRSKITIWSQDYTVSGTVSGTALLKVILRESDIGTHATAAHIRMQLATLDEYIGTIDSDIKKFNVYVKSLVQGLTRRHQTTNNLLTNLFKGYKAASDSPFVEYITRKEETKKGTIWSQTNS